MTIFDDFHRDFDDEEEPEEDADQEEPEVGPTDYLIEAQELAAQIGMGLAAGAAGAWLDYARHLVRVVLPYRLQEFSANPVYWLTVAAGYEIDHSTAMGSLFNKAARDGIIENTGRVVKSTRPLRHRGIVAIWRRKV